MTEADIDKILDQAKPTTEEDLEKNYKKFQEAEYDLSTFDWKKQLEYLSFEGLCRCIRA